ncbi:MAG: Holliday junction branch migration protein RuvA [bacterium]
MIAKLQGIISEFDINWIILDVGDVGYKVFVSQDILSKSKGKKITLYTHLHIRENLQELYGFSSIATLKIFEALISVSGVGPKGALGILSHSDADKIKQAIHTENPSIFTGVPGIGRKMASKIILELKNKLTGEELSSVLPKNLDEASEALAGLGYSRVEIARVFSEIPKNITDSNKQIKWALKKLGR